MTHDCRRYSADVLWQHMVPPLQPGLCPGCPVQRDTGPGTGANGNPTCQLFRNAFGMAGRHDQVNQIPFYRLTDRHFLDRFPGGKDHIAAHRLCIAAGTALLDLQHSDNGLLRCRLRVVHPDLEQKTIHLCLGQWVGTLLLNWVLGRKDQEQGGQGVTLAGNGHLAFFHRLQQRGLHLGRGPIDFVRQDQLVENGSRFEDQLVAVLAIVIGLAAGNVGGQQVRGELHPAQVHPKGGCQGFDGAGFGGAREPLQQNVAVAQQGEDQTAHHRLLANDSGIDPRSQGSYVVSQGVAHCSVPCRCGVRPTVCRGRVRQRLSVVH